MAIRRTRSKSPKRAASPMRKASKSPKRAASPKRKASKSPKRKMMRKASKSPKRKASKSPKRLASRRMTRKSMRKASKSPKRKTMRKTRKTRKSAGPSAFSNFRKRYFKKMMASPEFAQMTPRARFAAVAAAVVAMWKKASARTKSAVRKMVRSPKKVRKMRMSKKRAMKKSGSPRRARKDKGKKRAGRATSGFAQFYAKYQGAKKAALGTTSQKEVMKALGADWRAGIRSY